MSKVQTRTEANYYFRVKPVLVGSSGMDPFEPEIVTRYEETLLRSEAAGVKIQALLFCKWEFESIFIPQSLTPIV
jgi:hypothetical protein